LFTGTGGLLTITNNIDLSTKGGLVWLKNREVTSSHRLVDTDRGALSSLFSESTSAASIRTAPNTDVNSFTSTGFVAGNFCVANNYASWTFREQPKFFDIVTYTGTGSNTTIAHSLGVVPGCIIVKRTDTTAAWAVYHRSLANTQYLVLNTTAAAATGATRWNSTTPTSAVFSVGTDASVNASGGTYVAYIYAHDAGGFGLAGTDNVISCGSYTGNDYTSTTVTLGYEPQWVMIKRATGTSTAYTGWAMFDTMRGMPVSGNDNTLLANTSDAENPVTANNAFISPTATGFTLNVAGSNLTNTSDTYIYIAIRRGPMKVPTVGTSVFSPVARTGTGAAATVTAGFPVDLAFGFQTTAAQNRGWYDRMRGALKYLRSDSGGGTDAEGTDASGRGITGFDNNTGIQVGTSGGIDINSSGVANINWLMRRAPSFFDEVCYTGTGASRTISHNLQAVPELIIVKKRSGGLVRGWFLYVASLTSSYYIQLNSTGAATNSGTFPWNSTTPTSSVFSVSSDDEVNGSANTYIAYLFATCAGVSKVGTYTGNGTTQTIDCGLTAGARFVLLKRTDAAGDWYVYDTARGMTTLTDPYLLINSTAAEVATLGSVTTVATGFALDSSILAAINVSAATYIFLAIA
jgi:hypothetical protein